MGKDEVLQTRSCNDRDNPKIIPQGKPSIGSKEWHAVFKKVIHIGMTAGRLGRVGHKSIMNVFPGKTFLYCEPHKRIKEVLEEELSIKRDECHVKSPTAGNRATSKYLC